MLSEMKIQKKIGIESLQSVIRAMSADGKVQIPPQGFGQYQPKETQPPYNPGQDAVMDLEKKVEVPKESKKRKRDKDSPGKQKKKSKSDSS